MRFSTIAILCSFFAASSFASPVESSLGDVASFSKRCCILCDGPNRCGANEKREAVETEYEVEYKTAKRCCINCDNPYARCEANEKREAVETEHEALFGNVKRNDGATQWPNKRCCILCDNPYARCGSNDKRDFVSTLEEAVEETL